MSFSTHHGQMFLGNLNFKLKTFCNSFWYLLGMYARSLGNTFNSSITQKKKISRRIFRSELNVFSEYFLKINSFIVFIQSVNISFVFVSEIGKNLISLAPQTLMSFRVILYNSFSPATTISAYHCDYL